MSLFSPQVWLTGDLLEEQKHPNNQLLTPQMQQKEETAGSATKQEVILNHNCPKKKKKSSPTQPNCSFTTHKKPPSQNSACNVFTPIKVWRVTEQICVQMLQTPAQVLGCKPAVEHSLTWHVPTQDTAAQALPTTQKLPCLLHSPGSCSSVWR